MSRRTCICILCFLMTVSVRANDTIRIMTINIHQGSDTTLQALGEYIKQCHPDLVAVQEIDMWPQRPEAPRQEGKNFIAELSYYADLMGYFGKAWDHPGGWLYGDGILSRYPVSKLECHILPNHKSFSKAEPRQILIAHIQAKGHDICFASTHLCYLDKVNRMAQMTGVRKLMKRQKEKIKIVCGDLNSTPEEKVVSTAVKKWHDVLPERNTFPANRNAYAKYDYILVENKADIQVADTFFLCDYGITDHCACVADIVIPSK